MFLPLLIAAIIGYFLGAIPVGYLVARAHGINIFQVGSKNPGATNVKRCVGKGAGNLVFGLDALKGAIAAGWALLAYTGSSVSAGFDGSFSSLSFAVAGSGWISAGLAGLIGALLGHSYSCFTKFKGGKGMATGAGGFLVLMPLVTVIGLAAWVVTFYASRYVSLASIVAAVALPVAAWLLHQPHVITIVAAFVALFVVVRHRANITRLLNGTENRFTKKKPDAPTS